MGTYILITAVAAEIALAVFCIKTKSNQQKTKSIVRLSSLAAFALLAMLPIIEWSSRYYALAALLLLLAGLGAVSLLRKKEEKKAYKTKRVVWRTVEMTALIFSVTLPAILFPQYKPIPTTGDYQVATATYTYTDKSRIETYTDKGENRKLNVEMWYPENATGTYPLVVFSHGGFGIKSSNESLYNELASHGYVVCAIDHTYQCFSTTDQDGHTIYMDKGYMHECEVENARANPQQSYEFYQKWMNIRTGDINFVIDTILAGASQPNADQAYKLVDSTKIGVMGHSMGGSAALGIGRMRADVSAVIALESPFMCDIQGVKDGEFIFNDKPYPVPVLNVYSDGTWGILADRPQYAENAALLSGANPTAFNVHITGVGHLTLTDLALTTPILTNLLNGKISTTSTLYCLKTINKITLEFFDCYLKGKGPFTSAGSY